MRTPIVRQRLEVPTAFASIAVRYLLTILPRAVGELVRWRASAERIPDPVLHGLATKALAKKGNMLGAALFAVLAPRSCRSQVVRAQVAFQSAYNYLDMLAEQPSLDPVGNGRRLHGALLHALEPGARRGDYYACYPRNEDGGFLSELVETCWVSLEGLPSYALVASPARTAAGRIVDFQSLNLGLRQGGHNGLERWARAHTPSGSDLRWWETAAAGGSSLAVHALIALAARPSVDPSDLAAIDEAYFPTIGALHSLLDSMVDLAEDERDGQRNLISYYPSPDDARERLGLLAKCAAAATGQLSDSHQHRAILVAMACHYLAAPGACSPRARLLVRSMAGAAGVTAGPALAFSRASRFASQLAGARG
jgi:tetraprenyl-beta-curcumene synthase